MPQKRAEPALEALGSIPVLSAAASPPARIPSQSLFRGRREVLIEHGEREYRLRITGNGKLILTA
jgi:hemin uptake protein HemP